MKHLSSNEIIELLPKYSKTELAKCIVEEIVPRLRAANLDITFSFDDDFVRLSATIREFNDHYIVGVWKEFHDLQEGTEFAKMIECILVDPEIQRRYELKAFL